MPISRLRNRETEIACLSYGPRYSLILAPGFNFGIPPPACRWFWRDYTGYPKAWLSLSLVAISDMVKRLTEIFPSSLSGNLVWAWFACLRAYCPGEFSTAYGHLDLAGWSFLCIFYYNYLVLFYYIKFWKWALSPQNNIVFL